MKKLLYVCEADSGGIMEYAIRQVASIAQKGVEVHFLCRESFPKERLAPGIKVWEFYKSRGPSDQRRGIAGKIFRVWRMIADLSSESKQVAKLAVKIAQDQSTQNQLTATRYRLGAAEVFVLFACYKEYFAPFWVGPLRKLASQGVVIGTIAHDPVRDFVVGPPWWHRWSARLGYSFVRHVFVHDDTPVDFGGKRPEGIKVHQIPHGPYEVAEPKIGRLEMRRRFGFNSDLSADCADEHRCQKTPQGNTQGTWASTPRDLTPNESAKISEICGSNPSAIVTPVSPDVVFLAFGQVRDGKNLDLFLRAMTQLPENVKLLVAGKGDSGSSRSPEFYQQLSDQLGVADRCRWDIRRIPDEEVGDIFAACDVVLLTYCDKFRSASGVLNTAVSAQKPVLASSGAGPLRTVVQKYQLGIFVEPDHLEEVLRAASKLVPSSATGKCEFTPQPQWELYMRENSWEENARRVCLAFEIALQTG